MQDAGSEFQGQNIGQAETIWKTLSRGSGFLGDLLDFLAHSGATGNGELMSLRRADGSLAALRARSVRDELKITCRRNGLQQDYFSSHSLRKGAITQMRAHGSSEEDRRDRGNYAPGSQVMNNIYDYTTELGPLAANSLAGGYKPDLTDFKRLIQAARRSILESECDVTPTMKKSALGTAWVKGTLTQGPPL